MYLEVDWASLGPYLARVMFLDQVIVGVTLILSGKTALRAKLRVEG